MKLPFSTEAFFGVFRYYNLAVFPLQILFVLLAFMAVAAVLWKKAGSGKAVFGLLAVLWAWMGIAYHWGFFTKINPAAWLFGAAFVVQGGLFFATGVLRSSRGFTFKGDLANWVGVVLVGYALVGYPLLGHWLGHVYPSSPTFGLPCPTTIFTFGILLWLEKRPPFYQLIIPLLWSVVGTLAALGLGIREDFGLLVAGLATVGLWRRMSA